MLHTVRLIANLIQALANAFNRLQAGFHALGQVLNPRDNQGGIGTYFLQCFGHLTGCLGGSPGQLPDLVGNHRKAPPLIAGTRGLNCRVQGQQVGLLRNTLNGGGDTLDLVGFFVEFLDQPQVLTGLFMHRPYTVDG